MSSALPQPQPGPTFTAEAPQARESLSSARPSPAGARHPAAAARVSLMAAILAVALFPAAAAGEVTGMEVKVDSAATIAGAPEAASPEELIREGEACLANGDATRARDLFEEALRLRPDEPRALLGLGRALTARRRYIEADALYRDMEDRHIAAIEARLGRARLRSLQGDHEGARRFYKDALQAEPGNVEARLGMVREAHILGLDAQALPQVDSLVLDHPEHAEARALQKEIHDAQRPHIDLAVDLQDDTAGNRLERTTVTGTFMALPQTAVSVAVAGMRTESECGGAIDCAVFVTPPPIDGHVTTDSRTFVAGTVIRVIRPLTFEARVGAYQEEPLDGGRRTQLFGDGVIRWEAGP